MLAASACALLTLPQTGCESSKKNSGGFRIEPQAVTLAAADTPSQTFTASGGTEPYAWALDNQCLGSLNKTVGTQVTYTAEPVTGAVVLRAIDDAGVVSTAVIRQE